MENSSSSKTRSPARVLAALLAVVMLFIVMPVLPAGAAKVTLDSITFLNAKYNPADEDDIFFNPENDEQFLNSVPTEQEEATLAWAGTSGLQAQRPEGKTDSVKLTLESKKQFTSGTFGSKTFTFALYTGKENPVVSWSTMADGSSGTPLTSKGTVEQDGKVCNVYTLPQDGMTGPDVYIKVENGEPETPTYKATFSVADGVEVQADVKANPETKVFDLDTVEVKENKDLYLTVKSTVNGYEPKISVSGGLTTQDVNKAEGKYKITVTKDITVKITSDKKKCTVTLPVSKDEFKVNKITTTVDYGDPFEFTVTTTEGFKEPEVTVGALVENTNYIVTKNGLTRTFSIHSVTEDLNVTIDAGKRETYSVTVSGEGFDVKGLEGKATATYEEKLSFTVTAKEGWETTTPIVEVNGVPITGTKAVDGNGWTYSHTVTGNTLITVSNFSRKTYTVTVKNTEEYTLDSQYLTPVPFEGGFTFTLTLTAAYHAPEGITVGSVSGADVKIDPKNESSRSYIVTVSNVTSNVTLSFTGIKVRTYKVEIVDAAGGDGTGKFSVDKQSGTVNHGKGVQFTIKPVDGYRIDNVNVYVTGEENGVAQAGVMVNVGNGTYSISNVTSDYTVKVSVSAIQFRITIQSSIGTELNDVQMGSLSVTKAYAVNNLQGAKISLEDGAYKLQLPKATRKGYKLVGWRYADGTEIEEGALTFYGTADHNATVIAEWKINTELGQDGVVPFVQLRLTRTYDEKKDVLTVKHIASNIDANDVGKTVKLLSHGIIYGLTENALDDFGKLVEEGKITSADFKNSNSSTALTKLDVEGLDSVYYSSHDDSNKETGDMLADGHNFTESVKNPNQLQGSAAGYMIVEIGNDIYLFYSNVEKWAE